MKRALQAVELFRVVGSIPWPDTGWWARDRVGFREGEDPGPTSVVPPLARGWRGLLEDAGGCERGATSLPLLGRTNWEVPASWSVDPISGHDFGDGPSAEIVARPDVPDADLLRCWVRARLTEAHHAALRAGVDGDADAARFVGEIVSDFTRRNPAGRGPHWSTAMEAALRATRLLHAAAALEDGARSLPATGPALAALHEALAAHESFLERRCDFRWGFSGNHYLVALAGRYLVSAHLRPRTVRRRDLARATWPLFWRELRRQLLPDGLHFESSTGYHLLIAETAAHVAASGALTGRVVPRRAMARLRACAAATRSLARPDGTIARVGDWDDTRFLDLLPSPVAREPTDARDVLGLLAAATGDAGCAAAAGDARLAAGLLFGARTAAALGGPPPAPQPACLDRGGIVVLASPRAHVTVAATTCGRGASGGHAHDDAGSYEYWSGRPIVVDRGTGSYTGDVAMRQRYRSAVSHSVVQVDGREQNGPVEGRPFRRVERSWPVITEFSSARGGRVAVGHHGYCTRPGCTAVLRTFELDESGALEVVDDVRGAGEHDLVLRVQLAPGLEASVHGSDVIVTAAGSPVARLRFSHEGEDSRAPLAVSVAESLHSPRMGVEVPARTIEARIRAGLPAALRHRLQPA